MKVVMTLGKSIKLEFNDKSSAIDYNKKLSIRLNYKDYSNYALHKFIVISS